MTEALRFVRENYLRPKWAQGTISLDDALFLYEMLARVRPMRSLEIGVASGVSTAFISRVLTYLANGGRLHSFDAIKHFYADPSIACGAFLEETFGAMPSNVTLTTGVTGSGIPHSVGGERFDFAFVDANHQHPWPCLDMFSVIEVTEPGSWVALHDINLPFLHPQHNTYGPHYLYTQWPGEKTLGDTFGADVTNKKANIGAIKLFPSKEESILAVIECMKTRWHTPVPDINIKMAEETIRNTSGRLAEQFRSLDRSHMPAPKSTSADRLVIIAAQRSGTHALGSVLGGNGYTSFDEVLLATEHPTSPVKEARFGHFLQRENIWASQLMSEPVRTIDRYLEYLDQLTPGPHYLDIKYNAARRVARVYEELSAIPLILERAALRGYKFLHIVRENAFKRHLSIVTAEATGQYHVRVGEAAADVKKSPITMDVNRCLAAIQDHKRSITIAREWMRYLPHVELTYEAAFTDGKLSDKVSRDLASIGVAIANPAIKFKKIGQDARDVLANYDEVRSALKNKSMAWLMD